jgi:hypothetical protein
MYAPVVVQVPKPTRWLQVRFREPIESVALVFSRLSYRQHSQHIS